MNDTLRFRDILVLSPVATWPADQGNSKRVATICRELKARGARIHFVFYALGWGWTSIDSAAWAAMAEQWQSVHLVTPTRHAPPAPRGADYSIDDWWDYAIGDRLRWLFERYHFDAFVVNYAFFSKAFEFAPASTLKILDTHDRLSDRRQLMQSHGLAPEFFYTTQAEEAIALNRADLVWAIKDEEAAFFRTLTKKQVLCLPHVDPAKEIARRPRAADEDYLVVGMIGARNAINEASARQLLAEIYPPLRRRLAPVKFRLAGAMCHALADAAKLPAVELLGPVESLEDFYGQVDLVVVPITFSTGMKVKAVEALAAGVALVGTRHALEGIPVEHPAHCCADLAELGECIADLAFDPQGLVDLRQAGREARERLADQARSAYGQTVERIRHQPLVIVALHHAFFDAQAAYRLHAIQTLYFLRHFGKLIFYFDAPPPLRAPALFEALNYLTNLGAMAWPPAEDGAAGEALPTRYGMAADAAWLSSLVADGSPTVIWLLNASAALLQQLGSPALAPVAKFCRLDAIDLLPEAPRACLLEGLPGIPVAATPQPGRIAGQKSAMQLIVPFWRHLPPELHSAAPRQGIAILAEEGSEIEAELLAYGLRAYVGEAYGEVQVVLPRQCTESAAQATSPQVKRQSQAEALSDLPTGGAFPVLAIDITGGFGGPLAYRECLERSGVPIVRLGQPGALAIGETPGEESARASSECATLADLLALLADIAATAPGQSRQAQVENQLRTRYEADAGWTLLWRRLSQLTRIRW